MKEKIQVEEDYIKDCYTCWVDDNHGMSFKEYLYGDFETDPTIGAMLGVNCFSQSPNVDEFFAMTMEGQKKELELRLEAFYEEAAKMVGMTREQFEQKPE